MREEEKPPQRDVWPAGCTLVAAMQARVAALNNDTKREERFLARSLGVPAVGRELGLI